MGNYKKPVDRVKNVVVRFKPDYRLTDHHKDEDSVADIYVDHPDVPFEFWKAEQINAEARMNKEQRDKNQRSDDAEGHQLRKPFPPGGIN